MAKLGIVYSFSGPFTKTSRAPQEMAARREEQARLVAERKQKEQVPPQGRTAHGACSPRARHGDFGDLGATWDLE